MAKVKDPLRSQPYRLKWPLSPSQVMGADEMFEILFRALKKLTDEVDALEANSGSSVVTINGSNIGQLPLNSFDGEGEEGPMGPPGTPATSSSGSASESQIMFRVMIRN